MTIKQQTRLTLESTKTTREGFPAIARMTRGGFGF